MTVEVDGMMDGGEAVSLPTWLAALADGGHADDHGDGLPYWTRTVATALSVDAYLDEVRNQAEVLAGRLHLASGLAADEKASLGLAALLGATNAIAHVEAGEAARPAMCTIDVTAVDRAIGHLAVALIRNDNDPAMQAAGIAYRAARDLPYHAARALGPSAAATKAECALAALQGTARGLAAVVSASRADVSRCTLLTVLGIAPSSSRQLHQASDDLGLLTTTAVELVAEARPADQATRVPRTA